MKKIIKGFMLVIGFCLFAGTVNAQLSSDKPSLTAQQTADLLNKGKTQAKTTPTTSVGVSSEKGAMTTPQVEAIMQRPKIEVKPEATTLSSEKPVANSQTKATTISDQGGVKPVLTSEATIVKPVSTEPVDRQGGKTSSTPADAKKRSS